MDPGEFESYQILKGSPTAVAALLHMSEDVVQYLYIFGVDIEIFGVNINIYL